MTPTTIVQRETGMIHVRKTTSSSSIRPCFAARPGTFCLAIVIVMCFLAIQAEAYSPGRNCQFNRNQRVTTDEASCKFGWEVDACGNKVCTKGPGDVCGGKYNRYGICGEGLMCSNCNRCQGCSMRTFECFDDQNCIRY